MYLNQYWKDERLSFSPEENKILTLSGDFAEKIWVPDTFFANDKNRSVVSVFLAKSTMPHLVAKPALVHILATLGNFVSLALKDSYVIIATVGCTVSLVVLDISVNLVM